MAQDNPRSQCERWLRTRTRFNAQSLERITLDRIIHFVRIYPDVPLEDKARLRQALTNLLCIPAKYTSKLTQEILRSTWSRSAIINNQPVDNFLVDQLQSQLLGWLDFDRMSPNYRIKTILNLPRMPNLRKLSLRLAGPKPWSHTFTLQQSHQILGSLQLLRELTFQNLADDLFISILVEYSQDLHCLDVQGSVNVSNTSIESLRKLKRLVSIDLSGTSVDEDELTCFLAERRGFQYIGVFNQIAALEDATCSTLKTLYMRNPTQDDINKIVCSCQAVTELELRCLNGTCKLHRLGVLENLKKLHISGPNYRSSNLNVGLLNRSITLTDLYLEHMTGMDSCDLRTIGQYLKSLENLTLMNCCFSRGLMDRVEERRSEKKQLRLFTTLKSLNISSNISPSQFLLLTGHAVKLTRLQTGLSCWLSTRLLSHLVRLNHLQNLEYLRIDYTSDLCAAALFLLLKTARSLETIVGAETWQDMDQRMCGDLNNVFRRYHLPHTLVSFHSQIF